MWQVLSQELNGEGKRVENIWESWRETLTKLLRCISWQVKIWNALCDKPGGKISFLISRQSCVCGGPEPAVNGESDYCVMWDERLKTQLSRWSSFFLVVIVKFIKSPFLTIILCSSLSISVVTITAEILACSLANFYIQYADRHVNYNFCNVSTSESGQFDNSLS